MTYQTDQMTRWVTSGDGVDHLRAEHVRRPEPGPREVLVRIAALSLNYRDLLVIGGVEGWRPSAPVTPLSDAVGSVTAVGEEVTRFTVGDRVMPTFLPEWHEGPLTASRYVRPTGGPVNQGMLADFVVISEEELVLAPATLTDVEAATLPVAGVTSWHALSRTELVAGETVLVHGTGGVSLITARLASALGAEVILTSGSSAKAASARDAGFEHVINYREQDVASEVLRITGGEGADVVVETVGGSNLNVSLHAVRIGGRVAFVGLLGGLQGNINTYELVHRNVALHGIETGSRAMLEELVRFVDERGVTPIIGQVLAREAVAEGLRLVAASSHFGKVVLH